VADGKSSDTLWENVVALLTTSDVPRPTTLPELQGLQGRGFMISTNHVFQRDFLVVDKMQGWCFSITKKSKPGLDIQGQKGPAPS
jgi:hypothetical protein